MKQFVEEIVKSGQIAAILQCGGIGERLGFDVPKPLVDIGGGDRPLTNILQDLPPSMPVYLHLIANQVRDYDIFLAKYGIYGHRLSYLIQQDSLLYDDKGIPQINSDNTRVRASNGLVTFSRHFATLPKYFLEFGGPKVGVCFDDVIGALGVLEDNNSIDAIAFARELTEGENEKDKRMFENQEKKDHPRYARMNSDEQEVYEHPCMDKKVFAEGVWKKWLGLTGMYLFRAEPFTEYIEELGQIIEDIERLFRIDKSVKSLGDVRRIDGMAERMQMIKDSFMDSRSVDSIYKGKAYFIRTVQVLKGYNKNPKGIQFETYTQTDGHRMTIKVPEDIQKYQMLVQQGKYPKRKT